MAGKHPSGMSASAGGENVDRSALRAPFDEWGDGPGLSSHAIGTPEYRREIIRKALRGHVIAWTVASLPLIWAEIGRASCRERVCHYVEISVGAVTLKKKK